MQNQDKNKIIVIDDNINKNYGLAIDINSNLGNLENINYDYIKWKGLVEIKNKANNELKQVNFIEFNKKIPESIIRPICEEANKIIEENISISDAFKAIISLFQKSKIKKSFKEELLGDIAEALFVIKGKEILNINFQDHIRRKNDALYDFKFNEKFIEVKSSSKSKNDFRISFDQLNEAKNKILIISKFKYVEGETNIVELFNIIEEQNGWLCDIFKEKKIMWDSLNKELEIGVINSYTVLLKKCDVFVFKSNNLPIIKVEKKGSMKKMEIIIDSTDSNILDLKKLKEEINFID